MLVLLSFALVLVATVLLVLGLLSDDGLTLIWISIASSGGAAVVLLAALRANRSRTTESAVPDVEPLFEPALVGGGAETAPSATTPAAAAASAPDTTAEVGEWLAADQDDSWGDATVTMDQDDEDDEDDGEEVDFPIADYDTLSVGQILPLLPQLYSDEIDVVEERERLTKARPQVLARLAELRDAPSGSDPLASYTEPTAGEDGWSDDDDWFPIEDYESLSAAQILPLLPELDDEELTMVRERELTLGRRRSLLDEIERRLGIESPAAVPTPSEHAPAPAAVPASAPTAVTPAAAKRAPTTKATATKRAAASAKKATSNTTAKKAAPAKKAASTTTAKKAAPAKKAAAPAKTAATPAKKAATPAKKAAATKKAAAAKAPAAKRSNKA